MFEIIGLIPAAGQALRVAPLPCSKEIFPVGIHRSDVLGGSRPKVAAHYLLEQMHNAGARKAFIILRAGKWDIPGYFGDGSCINMDIAYLIMGQPYGVPYTLDQAYPFIQQSIVLFGFPDILMSPGDIFNQLLQNQKENGSDIALALFAAHRPEKMDMVQMGSNNKVNMIHIKPRQTDLKMTWIAAVWTPLFTAFMHNYLTKRAGRKQGERELFFGDIVQAAIEENLNVSTVSIEDGRYLDIGTPEDILQSASFTASIESDEISIHQKY